jgi:hypothetical protein
MLASPGDFIDIPPLEWLANRTAAIMIVICTG